MFSCTDLMQEFIKSLITYQNKKVEPVSLSVEASNLKHALVENGKWLLLHSMKL